MLFRSCGEFGASVEQVAHRLTTLGRSGARGRDGLTDVTITWAPREGADSNLGRAAILSIVAEGPDGPLQFKADATSRRATFAIGPGPLKIQTAVLDKNDEILERETHQVSVPNFGASRLALSAPMLVAPSGPRATVSTSAAVSPSR